MPKELWKGNEAIAEAAVRSGLGAYFGYPITPQTEVLEYLSRRMPELGRAFVQAKSELGAINMVYGAACTGVRVMSSSSSPGMSLMMEGISYIAGTEIPAVLVNVMRGGPGLGNIAPAQSDYNQAVRGGGHGDYPRIVLAPASVQEAIDLTALSFDLAEKYRMITLIILDGSTGQMMEPAEMPAMQEMKNKNFEWATNGAMNRERRVLSSIYLNPLDEEKTNLRLLTRWREVQANEVRYKEYFLDDAKYVVVGFGTAGRVALSAVREARAQGIKVGLLRPITVSPFPYAALEQLIPQAEAFLVTEMNMGQMLDDVLLTVRGRVPVEFYGRPGGVVPFHDEILDEIHRIASGPVTVQTDPRYLADKDDCIMATPNNLVYERPEAFTDMPTHYCPGCTHGVAHRLVAEVLEEMNLTHKTIGVAPVGCAVFAYNYFATDFVEAPHGRAPAMATGVKRVLPDHVVFTYQGDGDLASIGMGEIVHAAARGENITVIFINNANFGMTGGQMAPTTLPGMKTSSSQNGRDVETQGYPIKVSEMLSTLEGVGYCVRRSLHDPKNIRLAKKAIRTAFEAQVRGLGFSMVELLSTCPTNWGMTPVNSLKFVEEHMIPAYPLGDYKISDAIKQIKV